MKNAKPIIRLITFLQRDLKFIDEVCLTGRIIRFMYIRADARTAAKQLIDYGRRLATGSHDIAELNDINGESL